MKDNSSDVNDKDAKEAEKSHLSGSYHETLRARGVPPARFKWYQGWVDQFNRTGKKVPLASRSLQEIKALLESLEETPGLAVKSPVDI